MSSRNPSVLPPWSAVAVEMIRTVAVLQKRDFYVVGAITAALVLLSLWGLTNVHVVGQGAGQIRIPILRGLVTPLTLVGALWPLGVWRHDSPDRRGYFWSLPVPRGPHTLLRVGIGWLLLMGVCVSTMVIGSTVALLFALRTHAGLSLDVWYLPLATATLAYLLISVLAVLVESPVRWVIWTAVGLLGARIISEVTRMSAVWDTIDAVLRSLGIAFRGPLPQPVANVLGSWSLHYLTWIGLGSLALVAAAFRHRDAR